MSSEYRKAQMRDYANKRYAAMRLLSGGHVKARLCSHGQLSPGEERRRYSQLKKIDVGQCEICELVCDEHTHVAFAWDHLDRKTKTANISRMVWRKYTIQQIDDEIAKCRLLCHCCHAFVTYLGDHHKDQDIRLRPDHPQLFDYA
tara:strand:+ start:666 stop:1100 length:435 start_codon:yes stop_codon:yes gene_type:complete